jgi:hypothetical protein|tara:strand:- start:1496 stop:1675 length:180 start_codon:yes stop_codon:yes gene_type:complete
VAGQQAIIAHCYAYDADFNHIVRARQAGPFPIDAPIFVQKKLDPVAWYGDSILFSVFSG